MKRYVSWATIFILIAAVAVGSSITAMCARQGSGLSVALTIAERAGVARRSEPVTSGVPLARSLDIRSPGGLKLIDSRGQNVPAQFKVTSRWGGGPANGKLPIRWLLLDFQASVDAKGSATYYLKGGGSGSATNTGLRVTRNDADFLDISTGAARFSFSKRRFSLFDSVAAGSAQIVSGAGQSCIEATDPSGRTFSSSGAAPERVTLECDGPLRKTVLMSGPLVGTAGKLLDCTARISLFANSTEARAQLTVVNRRDPPEREGQPQCWDIGCPRSAVFSDLTLRLDLQAGSGGRLTLAGEGVRDSRVESGSLKIYQDSSGTSHWDRHRGNHPRPQSFVSFKGYKVYGNGAEVSSGNQAGPALDSSGGSGGCAVSVRDFWQNYPKALRGSGNRLEVSLFPTEYAGDYSFRPQEQKTHEAMFYFHGPGADAATIGSRSRSFQEPLFAACTPAYYLATGALGRVTGLTKDPEFADYEELNDATLDGEGANLYRAIGDAKFYSWQDYGDAPVDYEDGGTGTLNMKYNFELGMTLQFIRTGDFRWFKLAEAGGKHTADLDVLHYQGKVDAWWEGGFFGHSYHDEDSNANPNRNYGGLHPDLVFGAPGLFLLYHLTGNTVGYDAALEISNNVRYRYDNSYGRGNGEGFAEAPDYENGCESGRPFANGLMVMTEAYRSTGDSGYLDTAEWIIKNSHRAVDLFITDPVPGDKRYTKLFVWDMLEASLGRYLDLCQEVGREDKQGSRKLLAAMTRQEGHVMWKTDGRGNKGVPYAWMRDGTPWGWEEQEVAVNVCNWHLLTADALTYGYIYGGDRSLLDRAKEAFKTGTNPNVEYYKPEYTATKEATNSANFGLVYMHFRHPPGAVPAASTQFHTWICLQNPGSERARVKLKYHLGGGLNRSQTVNVQGQRRLTVDVNGAVGGDRDVATEIESDRPIVAERPMYFNYHGVYPGGHVVVGATKPSRKWFFAEGCTRPGFEQWLTIENANKSDSLVTLTYMLAGGDSRVQRANAAGRSRTTISVNDFLRSGQDVSTIVDSNLPVVVERPMYFNYRNKWTGGHDVVGATAPATDWYFAEGSTRSNPVDGYYEQWLCLQNPNPQEAHAHVSFLPNEGAARERDYVLPPVSRVTVDVNLELGPDLDISTEVHSSRPVVVERPIYFSFRGGWDGGHDVIGSVKPSKAWYFAEGCTRDLFSTWLCLGNYGNEEAAVKVEYLLGAGRNVSRQVRIAPRGRSTVDVNSDVGPGRDVSIRVSSEQPIAAERPMYFNYGGSLKGGHDTIGATSPSKTWHFAEGCTR